ncbi:MAG: hypothetical protein HC867_00385 [Bacteroidia bacterium]|nr:hypothetical protein [Bacteroidia bacterium]
MKVSLSVLVKISIASLGILLSPYYTVFGQLSFTEVASVKNLRVASVAKDGGFTWADFDNDGDKDVLVNSNNGTTRSRLLFNGGLPNYIFTDVTAAKAPALLSNTTERSAIAGDIDNDGDIDFIRNSSPLVEVYKNSGSPSLISHWSSQSMLHFSGPGHKPVLILKEWDLLTLTVMGILIFSSKIMNME